MTTCNQFSVLRFRRASASCANRPRLLQAGFTLIEMMITAMVIAILLTIALPSLSNFVVRSRTQATASQISMALRYARNEALARGTPVVVCARSSGSDQCDPSGNWGNGWIIYAGNVTSTLSGVQCASPAEPLIQCSAPVNDKVTLVGSALASAIAPAFQFSPLGMPLDATGTPVTVFINVCPTAAVNCSQGAGFTISSGGAFTTVATPTF